MSKTRPLYDVLGVSQNATEADICKAYRRQALTCHPDRNPDGAEQFKALSNAYNVLSDAEKRAMYDLTGVVPGSSEDAAGAPSMQERSNDMKREVEQFFESYAGSAEERADIVEGYKRYNGNFQKLLINHLLFDNGKETEVRRLHKITASLVREGKLEPTAMWDKSTTERNLRKLEARLTGEREEAEEALQELGLNTTGGDGDLMALQTLMKQRQQASWEQMMSGMEKKYLSPSPDGQKAGKKKQMKRSRKE